MNAHRVYDEHVVALLLSKRVASDVAHRVSTFLRMERDERAEVEFLRW